MKRVYTATSTFGKVERFDIGDKTIDQCRFAYGQIQNNYERGLRTTTQIDLPEGSTFTFEGEEWQSGAHADLGGEYIVEVERAGALIGYETEEGFMPHDEMFIVRNLLEHPDVHFGESFLSRAPKLGLNKVVLPEDRDQFRVALEGYAVRNAEREARLASRRERI